MYLDHSGEQIKARLVPYPDCDRAHTTQPVFRRRTDGRWLHNQGSSAILSHAGINGEERAGERSGAMRGD